MRMQVIHVSVNVCIIILAHQNGTFRTFRPFCDIPTIL
nr:MAG TPA: hypothetical protein [Caudoviricetes sp.]DAI17545.1 MAG TPA: hypothetical protein [Caudoviricetes sp.]